MGLEDRCLPAAIALTAPNVSPIGKPVVLGDTLIFLANNGLWKSDGTQAGTALISANGAGGSNLTEGNGNRVFFTRGSALWTSDLTQAGTIPLQNFSGGTPTLLTDVNGTLFFAANDGVHGNELWRSDGTAAGTVLVRDIYPGTNSGGPLELTNVNGKLYFTAYDPDHGRELWKSNGTAVGTVLVKDIWPGNYGSSPNHLTVAADLLFFSANDGVVGQELWVCDPRTDTTLLVRDINPGYAPGLESVKTDLVSVVSNGFNGLIFSAQDGQHGYELYRSQGGAAGTQMILDINPGPGVGSDPANLTDASWPARATRVFFSGDDGVHGRELWRSDGTPAGTVLVRDIAAGALSSNPQNLATVCGTLYFTADDGVHGPRVWESDGTAVGTVLVQDAATFSAPFNLMDYSGALVFTARDGANALRLWRLPAVVTHLSVLTPPDGNVGSAFSINVSADNCWGAVRDYAGTVHFTSSDPNAVLPGNYQFTPADRGMRTFNGVILRTAGKQTVMAMCEPTAHRADFPDSASFRFGRLGPPAHRPALGRSSTCS